MLRQPRTGGARDYFFGPLAVAPYGLWWFASLVSRRRKPLTEEDGAPLGTDPLEMVPVSVRFRRDHLALIDALVDAWQVDRASIIRMSALRELGITSPSARKLKPEPEK